MKKANGLGIFLMLTGAALADSVSLIPTLICLAFGCLLLVGGIVKSL